MDLIDFKDAVKCVGLIHQEGLAFPVLSGWR